MASTLAIFSAAQAQSNTPTSCKEILEDSRFEKIQLPSFKYLEGPVSLAIDEIERGARATFIRRMTHQLGRLPVFEFDRNPIPKIDYTMGGRLQSYLFHYNGVKYHISVVPGEAPNEPALLFNTGLTADSVSMWADVANILKEKENYKGTLVFFDPAGVGFSDTNLPTEFYQMHYSTDALVAALHALQVAGPFVFVAQSYGIFPWMDLTTSGRLTESKIVAYGTSPMQLGISAFSPIVRGLGLNGPTLADALFRFTPDFITGRGDGPALLYLLVGGGMPIQYAAQWGLGLTPGQLDSFYRILQVNIERYAQWGQQGNQLAGQHSVTLLGGTRDRVTAIGSIREYGRILESSRANGARVNVDVKELQGGTHVGVDPTWRKEIVRSILEKIESWKSMPANSGQFRW